MKFRPIRHSTMQIVIMTMLAILLPILAWLQYQWLDQLSRWEQERISDSLHANTSRFSEDFDRELSYLYRSFWIQITPKTQLRDVLWQRYANWRRQTPYPELLKTIHLYLPEEEDMSGLVKYLRGSKTFLSEAWPAQLSHVRDQLVNHSGEKVIRGIFWQESVAPVIIAPMSKLANKGGEIVLNPQHGWLILELDMNVMRKSVLPRMVEKYYSQGELAEFDIIIQANEGDDVIFSNTQELAGRIEQPDVMESFFSILYRDLQFVSTLQATSTQLDTQYQAYPIPPTENYTGMLSQYDLFQRRLFFDELDVYAGEVNFGQPASGDAFDFSRQLYPGGLADSESGLWTISAVHKAGSLDTAINHVRIRNLAIAAGILLILGVSAAVLVFSARRARRLARQQMEFVAGVTHELRTPLTIIRAAGDNLADAVIRNNDQLKKYGRLIENQGRRLSDMVEKILLFSRIQSGHQEYRFSRLDPSEIIHDALRDTQRLREKYESEITVTQQSEMPGILGDREALVSVVTNLISNALKYGRSDKPVELTTSVLSGNNGQPDEIRIAVKDHGRGIPASEHDEIFKPFYRGQSVRNEQLDGSGLGLSLVRQIVEAHNGRIAVESRINQGSTFLIMIPVITDIEETNEKTTAD